MMKRFFLAALALAPVLAACADSKPVGQDEYNDMRIQNGGDIGKLGGGDGLVLGIGGKYGKSNGTPEEGGALGVNAYLWRATLDTLSFMPLSSADPFGGVIITDWYQPPQANNERFKATAYILGRQLRADGIRISIFRQAMHDGRWQDENVSATTIGELEDKVLARARELKEQATGH